MERESLVEQAGAEGMSTEFSPGESPSEPNKKLQASGKVSPNVPSDSDWLEGRFAGFKTTASMLHLNKLGYKKLI